MRSLTAGDNRSREERRRARKDTKGKWRSPPPLRLSAAPPLPPPPPSSPRALARCCLHAAQDPPHARTHFGSLFLPPRRSSFPLHFYARPHASRAAGRTRIEEGVEEGEEGERAGTARRTRRAWRVRETTGLPRRIPAAAPAVEPGLAALRQAVARNRSPRPPPPHPPPRRLAAAHTRAEVSRATLS